MTPQEFIAKWQRVELTERSAAQQHFLDLCELLGQPKPAAADPEGAWYTFERGVRKTGGGEGWADVWMRGHFGWEYKKRRRNLAEAYQQLLLYREDLENPPLLVVCDMDRFEVHTNFTGTVKRVHAFDLNGLADPHNLDILRKVFTEPRALRPEQTTVGITEAAAGSFGQLADSLRMRGVEPERGAHFLMKLIFCLFAEDIGLLPKDLFTKLLEATRQDPPRFARRLQALFRAMADGGDFGVAQIAYFNGGLFADDEVIELRPEEIEHLVRLGHYDWSDVEPSIFGTLFERTLDPDKRAQIGAHYTSKDDILTLVEPVLMAPLRREWAEVKRKCDELWPKVRRAARRQPTPRRGRLPAAPPARKKHDKCIQDFVERLARVRVLDPACGSGNFLYVAIQLLLELEKEVIAYAADRTLDLVPHVRPTQLHGIEINRYAHELAQVVIWIGYLQWMHHNGFVPPRDPVLEPIESVKLMDAILDLSDPDNPREPDWPQADVIVGNPPFLGSRKAREELGDSYINALQATYKGRVREGADLCCYWFEKARAMIAQARLGRAGLLATQGIRGGSSRRVLDRVKDSGDIFFGVADREWILDGAAVHISMIGFDDGSETVRILNDKPVPDINADLTVGADLTHAKKLETNLGLGFQGTINSGVFDITSAEAQRMIASPNPSTHPNTDVVRPWVNGLDITRRRRNRWIIDFGCELTIDQASQYEAPFEHLKNVVKPHRDNTKYAPSDKYPFWQLWCPRPEMRAALAGLERYIGTPRVTKFRLFVWLDRAVLPDAQVIVFAREDDYFFGVLHSAVHERWSLRMGTALEDRPRYTPTTCFETFAFPPLAGGIAEEAPPPGEFAGAPEQYDPHQARSLRERIGGAAGRLNELRESWLNPVNADGSPALAEAQLKKRTLTNLYNERPTWLEQAHLELDRAVLAGYGWPEAWADGLQPKRDAKGRVNPILGVADPAVEEEVFSRLLSLNLGMASGGR